MIQNAINNKNMIVNFEFNKGTKGLMHIFSGERSIDVFNQDTLGLKN